MVENEVENITKSSIMHRFVGLGKAAEVYSKHYIGIRGF